MDIMIPCKIIVEKNWSKIVNTFLYKRKNMHKNDIIEFQNLQKSFPTAPGVLLTDALDSWSYF